MRHAFKRIRESQGRSQTDFAVAADLSIATVSAFESGRVSTFSPRIRRRLADTYRVDIAEIDAACGVQPVVLPELHPTGMASLSA